MKAWFNRRFPWWRLCLKPWCLRGQTYQHRCERHQDGYTHPTLVAIRKYRAEHPEADVKGMMIQLQRNDDGTYTGVSHRMIEPWEEEMFGRCCCHPGKPRHHD